MIMVYERLSYCGFTGRSSTNHPLTLVTLWFADASHTMLLLIPPEIIGMDSATPIRVGDSEAAASAAPCSNTFWFWMGTNKRASKASTAEFARVFRARPRYRYRVRESPQATGDGLLA